MIKDLIRQINEEVVSFVDYRNKKLGILSGTIKEITCTVAPELKPYFTKSLYSYEEFQTKIYEVDKLMKDCPYPYINFDVHYEVNGQPDTIHGEFVLGDKFFNIDLITYVEDVLLDVYDGKKVTITNKRINQEDVKPLEAPKQVEKSKQSKLRPCGKTNPQDVAVGDILEGVFSYSMTFSKFFRVTKRTNATIEVETLDKELVDNDGTYQTYMPVNKVVPNRDVDGRKFRIQKFCVAKIDNYTCNYWDGKPSREDRWD